MSAMFQHNGNDCWQTWFIEECVKFNLFGVTESLKSKIMKYNIGSTIYLADAPYFKKTNKNRICGPFVIEESYCDDSCIPIKNEGNRIVIYEDLNPRRGPWIDRMSIRRNVDGISLLFNQTASRYDYYPYRFRILKQSNYVENIIN